MVALPFTLDLGSAVTDGARIYTLCQGTLLSINLSVCYLYQYINRDIAVPRFEDTNEPAEFALATHIAAPLSSKDLSLTVYPFFISTCVITCICIITYKYVCAVYLFPNSTV